ncbi:hypothetical protein [Chitinimonas sp. BJYL2]|uniref:hypothetical protein n=1 Tax=Chitinimonas sp. BJYL2 TaxID=2976696 RepID=UPI0022B2D60F|nr:hypothetical protein [Chitinimonas sp. BJYL2]
MTTRRLLCAFALLSLAACSQLQQTGRAVADNNGVLQDSEIRPLGNKRYHIRVVGSSVFFDGQAETFFRRRAEAHSQRLGCKSWALVSYKSGTENTMLGARQYVDGVIECR